MLHKRTESIVQKLSSAISFFRIKYSWYGSFYNQIRTALTVNLKPYKPHISSRVFYFSVLLSSIGISFALRDRYSGYWLKPLLNRNLPALGQLQKNMSWETLETIVAEQLGLNSKVTPLSPNHNLALEEIDLYSNFLVMRVNPVWNKLVSQKFVGVILSQEKVMPSCEDKTNTEGVTFGEDIDPSLSYNQLNGLNSHWYKIPARGVVNPLITLHMKSLAQKSLVTKVVGGASRQFNPRDLKSSFPVDSKTLPIKEILFTYADEIPYKLDSLTSSRETSALQLIGKTNRIALETKDFNDNLFQESPSSLLQEKSESDSLSYQSSVPSSSKIDIDGINQKEESVSFIGFLIRKGLCINNTQDLSYHQLRTHSLVGLSFPSTLDESLEENLLGVTVFHEDVENNTAERGDAIQGFDSLCTTSQSLFSFEGVLPSSELDEFEELEEIGGTSETEEREDIDESKKVENSLEMEYSLEMIEEMGILPSIGAEKFNTTFADIITHIFNNSPEFSQLLGWGERVQMKQSVSFSPIFQTNSWLQPRLMSGYIFLDSNLSSLKPQIQAKDILGFRHNLLSELLKNGFHLPLEIPFSPTLTSSCQPMKSSISALPTAMGSMVFKDFLRSNQLDVFYRDVEIKGSEYLREALLDRDLEKGFHKVTEEGEGYTVFKRIGEQDVLQRYRDLLQNNGIEEIEETIPSLPETSSQESSETFVPFDFRAYPNFFYKGLAFFPDSATQDLDTINHEFTFGDDNDPLTSWRTLGSGPDNLFSTRKSDFFGKKIVLRNKLPHLEREAIKKRFSVPFGFSDKNPVNSSVFYEDTAKKLKQNPPFTRCFIYKTSSLAPSKRYLDIPYLTPSEWYTILKAELHLHLVKEAVEASKFRAQAENVGKEYKVREITVFLPSIGMRKAREEAVEWPLTRREYQRLDNLWPSQKIFAMPSIHSNQRKEKNCQLFSLIGSQNRGQEGNLPWALKLGEFKGITITNHTASPTQPGFLPSEGLDSIVYGYIPENASLSFEKSTKGVVNSQIGSHRQSPIRIFHLEPITRSSWLALYQIAVWLLLFTGMKYFYRVAFKGILLSFLDGLTRLGVDSRQTIKRLTETPPRTVFLPNRRFQNVAGIDSVIPDLGELVWFLRNSARGYNTPRGILLVGSPGTGKTFLIQAIAGEAEVPVIYESVSTGSPVEAQYKTPLELAFRTAQRQAPCILFLDEIDSIGASREGVITNSFSRDGVLDSLHVSQLGSNSFQQGEDLMPKRTLQHLRKKQTSHPEDQRAEGPVPSPEVTATNDLLRHQIESQENREMEAKRVALLGELLKEMDGLRALKGVVVIGATNRPDVLDPALLRPGRFERIIELGLPGKRKRLDILKLYSQNIGLTLDAQKETRKSPYGEKPTDNNELPEANTYWDYLATRTMGLTPADLAAAMNHSAIQAIIQNTSHTIETIEYGLDYILGFSEQSTRNSSCVDEEGLLSLNRFAYYQAGKAVVHTELPLHPEIASLRLWSDSKKLERKNSLGLTESVGTGLAAARRIDFETRLIGFYAGKAAELLILSCKERDSKNLKSRKQRSKETLQDFIDTGKRTTSWAWQSDLGFAELLLASSLAHSMIDKWYFYFQGIALRKATRIKTGRNIEELKDKDTIEFMEQLSKKSTRKEALLPTTDQDSQKWSLPSWWQKQVSQPAHQPYAEWFRIYLKKAEQTLRNEEWVPADQYYHQAKNIKDLSQKSSSPLPFPISSQDSYEKVEKGSCEAVTFGEEDEENKKLDTSTDSPKPPPKEITISFKDWNELYLLDRDYAYYSLVIACFNRAFLLLDENRELLDSFAYYLLRLHTLRQHEILQIFLNFKQDSMKKDMKSYESSYDQKGNEFNTIDRVASSQEEENLPSIGAEKKEVVVPDLILPPGKTLPPEMSDIEIIEKYWGSLSRRNAPRFINFSFIKMPYQS